MNADSDDVNKQRLELEQYLLKVRDELDKRALRLQSFESELQKLQLKLDAAGQGANPGMIDVGLIGVASSYRRSLEKKMQEMNKERKKLQEDLERAKQRALEVEEELKALS